MQKILSWGVTVLTPFIILMLSIRILITPVFARVEYRMPGFPEDPFGFTFEDRLRWSEPSINYLVNSWDISYLETLKFDDGESLFNDQELSHMEDVKVVVTAMRIVLTILVVGLLVSVIVAVRQGWRDVLLFAFRRGGWAVIGLIAAILLFVALNFNQLFTWFHQLFFESGTWQFYTSDTLIRLFPMRFWQDAFIFVGGLSLIFGILLIVFSRPTRSN
jgi:integral membrane protein (TIGR01906 family)